jgi:UDP-galactopyranose mutase
MNADNLVAGRVVEKTVKRYVNMVNIAKRFWRIHNKTFKVPLNLDMVYSFFGHITQPDSEDKYKAVTTVSGYKSALKWWYKEQNSQMSDELESKLEQLMQGYRRLVSDLKQNGKMNVFEGNKNHFRLNNNNNNNNNNNIIIIIIN